MANEEREMEHKAEEDVVTIYDATALKTLSCLSSAINKLLLTLRRRPA